ncbi:MAG: hypothetical protein M2R45_02019 [Verrucomicrobia subdivision 3 bacterium]|nr:hypothetical protein [Limisphaerales bacterium]MCS1414838.1 hypothetical protein [Limisphaerales bacterium]
MIVLHGLGDSIEGYRWLPPALNLPWLNYALVNAPDGYFGGYSWYGIQGDSNPGVVRSRKLLFELLDHFREEGFLTESTYLFGFSQGCLMTWEIGMRYPHCLAACIGISGYVHQVDTLLTEISPLAKQQHFLITHGYQDPLIPLVPVRDTVKKIKRQGFDVDWREFQKEHTIAGAEEIDLIRQFVLQHRKGSTQH